MLAIAHARLLHSRCAAECPTPAGCSNRGSGSRSACPERGPGARRTLRYVTTAGLLYTVHGTCLAAVACRHPCEHSCPSGAVLRLLVPSLSGTTSRCSLGMGTLRCSAVGVSRGGCRFAWPPVPAPRAQAGTCTRPRESKTRLRRIRLHPSGLPRRRRSEDDVGEPVPVRLDVRMTAAAKHDKQFFGEGLERGGA